ncbi:MAG: hypothetical protein ACK559_37810, partial [bacterium]
GYSVIGGVPEHHVDQAELRDGLRGRLVARHEGHGGEAPAVAGQQGGGPGGPVRVGQHPAQQRGLTAQVQPAAGLLGAPEPVQLGVVQGVEAPALDLAVPAARARVQQAGGPAQGPGGGGGRAD